MNFFPEILYSLYKSMSYAESGKKGLLRDIRIFLF